MHRSAGAGADDGFPGAGVDDHAERSDGSLANKNAPIDGTHAGSPGPPVAAPPPSAQAQKLQQLPKAQQDRLIQQDKSLDVQKTLLLKAYPSVAKLASARAQQWVDEVYGPGYDVNKLYLVRYGKDPHGHASLAKHNPKLDQEGVAAEAKPLWQLLRDNMFNGTLITGFGNGSDYSAHQREYKIVDAGDVGKNYNDAKGVLDPEKLYYARDQVADFKSEQAASVDRYYHEHGPDAVQWARQRALTQLELQHATGGMSDEHYIGIKTLLETGQGGKVFTLATGQHVLAGGFRVELDSGKNFTYLPKEEQPYQAFDNSWDATASIRAHGNDPRQAADFTHKYRSLLGDPDLDNTKATQDLQDGSTDKLHQLRTNRMTYDELYKAQHGREYEITQDPFGELVNASHRNDRRDVQDGVTSNEDMSWATRKKWGQVGLEVAMDIAPVLPGDALAGVLGKLGQAAAEAGELAGNAIKDSEEAGVAARAGAEGATEASTRGASNGSVQGTGDGNLGAIDELDNANHPSSAASPSGLPPKATIDPKELELLEEKGVYRDKESNNYATIDANYYQVSYDKQVQAWRAVDPSRPNDFTRSVLVELDRKGGAKPLTKPALHGGMDPPQPSTSSQQAATQLPRFARAHLRDTNSARNFVDKQNRHPFVRSDGSVDVKGFKEYWNDETYAYFFTDEYGNHTFRLPNGRGDVDRYRQFMSEDAARNVVGPQGERLYVNWDGSVNVDDYRAAQMERAASNYQNLHGRRSYRQQNGSVDVKGYKDNVVNYARARRYTNEKGEQPFIWNNGSTKIYEYYRYVEQYDTSTPLGQKRDANSARDFVDGQNRHPFVRSDGSVDVKGFKEYWNDETYAYFFTDEKGNHPFRLPNGRGDVDRYRQFMSEDAARNVVGPQGERLYVNWDGSVNVGGYRTTQMERAASNYRNLYGRQAYRQENGSVDVRGYKRHVLNYSRARRYTNEKGEQPFIRDNGSTKIKEFNRYAKQYDASTLSGQEQEIIDDSESPEEWFQGFLRENSGSSSGQEAFDNFDETLLPPAESLEEWFLRSLRENSGSSSGQEAFDDFDETLLPPLESPEEWFQKLLRETFGSS